MKRVVEKVKDIVEICAFTHLHDFAADPGLTLAGYHFTDITADLMAKWIDRVAAVRAGQGGAYALAGFRGVGKSHFISVLAAIVARPELRARIMDQHVASSAERLSRRHGQVAFVRRGSGPSLLDELKHAVGLILETNPSTLNDSLYDLLLSASEKAGDVPLVLLIDTAMGRDTRVSRDDGAMLSEIADAAKALGIFVGVALDDDISGADGPNASISANFSIDYLDQEHLYKIVDSVIFTKYNQKRAVLHEIYEDYRAEMPGFRWSEQRFTSLYPLHPATVEIAPLVRLYIQDFGLLGFAAEAGVKILGRPANSLIGIDEVFDSVENRLRSVPELEDAFVAFERLEREVITRFPVLFRHPAKLILKGLLILSLNGDGVSSPELSASMMISDGQLSDGQGFDITALLDAFAEALPGSINKVSRDGILPKYSFRLTSKLDVDGLLAEAVKTVADSVVWRLLLGQTGEKYSDFDAASDTTSCSVEWRGAIRRGELIWPPSEGVEQPLREGKEKSDWTIRVEPDTDDAEPSTENAEIVWHLAKPTTDEKDAIRRNYLLQNDAGVREQMGEALSTAMHVHSMAIEKIWQRVFFQDSYLAAGGLTFKFTEDARSAHSLAQVMTLMLRPVFEGQFPAHPQFSEHLGHKQAAGLISNFFGGSDVNSPETQKLAEAFAFPLGLAAKVNGAFVPTPAEQLVEHEIVRAGFAGADAEAMVPVNDIAMRLQAPPVGLTREAQHLILAALVAAKRYEFVTSSGNRINYRSLDLQIIWDDIVGVAKPLDEAYSPERLLAWAKLITGNAGLKSIDRSEDRSLILDSLSGWLSGWNESRTLAEFDALPDEHLNAAIWRTAANLKKSFGAMADIIGSLVKNDLSLDKCLQSIADLFSDSEAEFENKKGDLRVLREFTSGVTRRSEIATYLSLCEDTGDVELEFACQSLLETINSGQFGSAGTGTSELDADWQCFRDAYTEYYAEKHDAVMNSTASGESLREIVRSDEWAVFENFSSVQWLENGSFPLAKSLIREMRQLYCTSNVRGSLISKPFCGCSFSLAETERLVALPSLLKGTVDRGLDVLRSRFVENSQKILDATDSDAMRTSVKSILTSINEADQFPKLTSQDIRILKIAAQRVSDLAPESRDAAGANDEQADSISDHMHLWEQELKKVEDFVNTEI
ncbi:MAG: hypothetical protein ABL999_02390 [Pyrinomonadaceae bacterium]